MHITKSILMLMLNVDVDVHVDSVRIRKVIQSREVAFDGRRPLEEFGKRS